MVPQGAVAGTVRQPLAVEDYDNTWLTEVINCSGLSSVANLKNEVSGPLRRRIPIDDTIAQFPQLKDVDGESVDKVFEKSTTKHCPKVMDQVKLVLSNYLFASTTENSFIGFWDIMILRTLGMLFAPFPLQWDWDRDTNKFTSTGSNRPDFIFRIKNVCVFRGKEKKADVEDKVPRQELTDKLL